MSGEAKRLLDHLVAVYTGYRVRATTNVARELLLHGDVIKGGCVRKLMAKSCGAGVYEVWLE